jgi:DNA-binding MarR family transcriptional regulator
VRDVLSERPDTGPGRRPTAAPAAADPAATDQGATDATAAGDAAELLAAVSTLRRATRRAARRSWQSEPLPPAQSELLRLAAAMPGLTVAQAAQELRLAPNTVSTLIGKLTEKGLLRRVPSSSDGRSVLLEVTAKARSRMAEWRDLRADLAGRALVSLSTQERAALATAIPAMRHLAERMEPRDQV